MLHNAIFLLLLYLGSITTTIQCPYFVYGRGGWLSKTCSQSSYCQYTDASFVNAAGGRTSLNVFDCGIPENEVTSNTKKVESEEIPKNVKDIYPVEKSEYCPQGHGRWCRVTRGPESCSHCKLIECRCNVDNCHAFVKEGGLETLGGSNNQFTLLEELSSSGMTTEGGCSDSSELRCSISFLLGLLILLYL